MNKRKLGSFVLCALLLALSLPAEAQQPKKIPDRVSSSQFCFHYEC